MKNNKLKRQSLSNRIVHWTTAISIFVLIISGLGQLPLYQRYNVDKLPGGPWLVDYMNTLYLHYIAAIVLVFIVIYHIVYHFIRKEYALLPKKGDVKESIKIIKAMITKGEEPPSDKYLAEQRLAYLFIGINVLLLVITGIFKMIKNVPGVDLPYWIVLWSAMIHNVATVFLILGIVAHLGAFLFKENRKMLPGMFTGYVDEEYVRNRHPLWYERMKSRNKETEKLN